MCLSDNAEEPNTQDCSDIAFCLAVGFSGSGPEGFTGVLGLGMPNA